MKIALIGNMNNNNFALMRYFRDLGADAHLLLFKGDGCNSLSHFRPEFDTWEIDKWLPFIHQTDVENSPFSVLGRYDWSVFLYRPVALAKTAIKRAIGYPDKGMRPPSRECLKKTFCGYDFYVGSGLTPAILDRIGIRLDIFFPYACGIEFLGDPQFIIYYRDSSSYLIRAALDKVSKAQKKGIRSARKCITADMGATKKVFDEIGVNFLPLACPMVYNRELPQQNSFSENLKKTLANIGTYDFKIFSHARQMWVNPGKTSDTKWESMSKHSDWLIRAFAEFLGLRKNVKAMMFMVEYGPDVDKSKGLCKELGIESRVSWLPKMPRKELMQIIRNCDIGVGEFATDHGIIWGGTGWEVLASGKPLLQGFNFHEGEFDTIFGYPPPPMLPVKGVECIIKHLLEMFDNPEKRVQIAEGALNWFNKYNGIGLAKQWLELLKDKDSSGNSII